MDMVGGVHLCDGAEVKLITRIDDNPRFVVCNSMRATHLASPANEKGALLWPAHRFRTTAVGLKTLWARLPVGHTPADVTIVMEPTRNAGSLGGILPEPKTLGRNDGGAPIRPACLLRQTHQKRPTLFCCTDFAKAFQSG